MSATGTGTSMKQHCFTNQATNLSTLNTALSNLCRAFDEASKNPKSTTTSKNDVENQANEYLDSLVQRVDDVDDALMKSTEHLLPTLSRRGEASRMTATELSQVLSSLHAIHSQQIQRIEKALDGLPANNPSDKASTMEETTATESPSGGDTPYHWSLGLPLEKVVETDNETDRYSYGSASTYRSVSRTPFSQGPATPCTPSLRDLRLSASTATILTHDVVDSPILQNVESFQDEYDSESHDESIATDALSQTTLDKAVSSSTATGLDAIRKYHAGIGINNENMDDASITYSHQLHDEDDDEEESVDESTLCPTVVAEDRKTMANGDKKPSAVYGLEHSNWIEANKGHGNINEIHSQNNHQSTNEAMLSPEIDVTRDVTRQHIFRNQNQHDISHVILQNDTSPSQTLLTMDATMYLNDNDADGMSQSSRPFNDAASLGDETPVLDRYRIISDDNSIGFKVLPNERGSHRKTMHMSKLTEHENSMASISGIESVPKTVNFHGKVEGAAKLPYPRTPHPGPIVDHSSEASGSTSVSRRKSKIRDIASPFKFQSSPQINHGQLDKENPKVVASSPLDRRQSRSFGHAVSFNPQLESPAISKKSSKTSFRKTPYRKAIGSPTDISPASHGLGSRPDTMVQFEGGVTPLKKDTTPTYRTTPHAKITERGSMESLKFRPTPAEGDYCNTPANEGDYKKKYRKTPHAKNIGAQDDHEHRSSQRVGFVQFEEDVPDSTSRGRSVAFRKIPHRGQSTTDHDGVEEDLHDLQIGSPVAETHSGKAIALASPASLSSDITGLTGLSCSENQRELFPPIETTGAQRAAPSIDDVPGHVKTPRKSTSSMIARIDQDEFDQASPLVKLQFSLEETNQAISALNGAAFLRMKSAESIVQFTDTEAYKILRNCGFKRRRCKGLLMSLCHWRRLAIHEEETNETDFGVSSHYFEIVQ